MHRHWEGKSVLRWGENVVFFLGAHANLVLRIGRDSPTLLSRDGLKKCQANKYTHQVLVSTDSGGISTVSHRNKYHEKWSGVCLGTWQVATGRWRPASTWGQSNPAQKYFTQWIFNETIDMDCSFCFSFVT